MGRGYLLLAIFILVANFLDGWLTLWWINLGWATEKNPLLQELVERPVPFLAAKMVLVGLGVVLLYSYRHRTLAFLGLLFAALVYAWVLAHHLSGALWSLRHA